MKNSHCSKNGEKGVAVLLFDMQPRFIAKLRSGEADRIKANQLIILEYCREFGIPVIVLTLRKDLHGPTAEVLMNEIERNTQAFPIDRESNDGFRRTELESHLKAICVRRLFFVGIFDYAAIRHTAETAIKLNYEIMTSDTVIAGPRYRTDDKVAEWFESKGICFDSIEEFMKVIQSLNQKPARERSS